MEGRLGKVWRTPAEASPQSSRGLPDMLGPAGKETLIWNPSPVSSAEQG